MLPHSSDKRATVSLTYDGTQLCHAETVLPQLESCGLLGTFYADPLPLLDSLPIWREAVNRGHEVGNGCLIGSMSFSDAMDSWTPEMIADDIDESDRMLTEVFPQQSVFSFAYPAATGGAFGMSYLRRIVEERHSVCRSFEQGYNQWSSLDLAYLRSAFLDDMDGDEIIELVSESTSQNDWVILAMEGVGSGEPAIDAKAHRELCDWLAKNADKIEVLTVCKAAQRMQQTSPTKLRLL